MDDDEQEPLEARTMRRMWKKMMSRIRIVQGAHKQQETVFFDPDLEDDLSTAGTVSDPLLAKKTPLSPRKPEHGEKMPWTLLEAMSIMMDT